MIGFFFPVFFFFSQFDSILFHFYYIYVYMGGCCFAMFRFVNLYLTLAFMALVWFPLLCFCFALLCFVLFCFVMFCFVLLCFALLCFVSVCFISCLFLVALFSETKRKGKTKGQKGGINNKGRKEKKSGGG